MRERLKPLLILIVIALLLVGGYNRYTRRMHHPIAVADVAEVKLWPSTWPDPVPATPEETANIIASFRKASAIANNPDHAGPGCGHPTIIIQLQNGEQVAISHGGSGPDGLRVQREVPPHTDYWFRQPELERFITEVNQRSQRANAGC